MSRRHFIWTLTAPLVIAFPPRACQESQKMGAAPDNAQPQRQPHGQPAFRRDRAGRPCLDDAYHKLIADLASRQPGAGANAPASAAADAFRRLDTARILVVAGPARREARASIRGFGSAPTHDARKPSVRRHGIQIDYEICLRPLFFRHCTAEERLAILIHELWHAAPAFDGTLNPAHRHDQISRRDVDRAVRELAEPWFAQALGSELDFLSYEGEIRMRSWLVRPPSFLPADDPRERTEYDERLLFPAIIEQRTPRAPT